jgi:dTDP-4-dehydrorhamnose reductase|tara:strand:+ start:3873 stop:4760 length:888 start_codon:yes stop_codon:yes gene_type:complete
MKILIIGGSGSIGSYFVRELLKQNHNLIYTYYKNKTNSTNAVYLDIQDRTSTIKIIEKTNPELIIICNALTGVDLCEENPSLTNSINVKGTQNIVDGCNLINCKIVFISTSAVFDGTKNEYFENDIPNPTSVYGMSKLQGELIIKNSNLPFLILRTDQPYCWKEKWQHTNSVIRVIENLEKNQTFDEITDWCNTPTYVPDFIKASLKLIENKSQGIFHLVGSDYLDRFSWAEKTAKIFNLKKELIKPVHSSKLKLLVERKNIHLNNDKLFQKIQHRMIGVDEGLQDMANTYNNFS